MFKSILPFAVLSLWCGAAGATGGWYGSELDVDIVSDRGRHFPVFPVDARHDDTYRAYLEAVPGENYSIRIRNRSGGRIGLVIAVDGRNIISGERSDLDRHERMYILGPYQSVTYRGWRTARNRVNRFYFTDADDSYASAFGDRSAMGVIAIAAFRERGVHRQRPHRHSGPEEYGGAAEPKAGARAAPSQKSERFDDSPGTGFGDERYSPSVRVHFEPERRPFERHFLKYEWRETLCEMGIRECRPRNRFWDDSYGYAPYPPNKPRYRHWRRHY